jgi:methylphosphotriester-DNA--protein-cysteine methyltransferase
MFERLRAYIKKALAPPPSVYVGHWSEKIYHLETCDYGRKIRRGRYFVLQSQAVKAGFRPCMVCQPDRKPYDRHEWVPDFWERRESD